MKSSLQIHKEAVRAVEQRIFDLRGAFLSGAYGREKDAVGSFAVLKVYIGEGATALMPDLSPVLHTDDYVPVQSAKWSEKAQKLMPVGNRWRNDRYGAMILADVEAGIFEYHELRDIPDHEGYEDWVPLYRL